MVANLAHFTANALIPDQLICYVQSISGLNSKAFGQFLLHYGQKHGVLVAYPGPGKDISTADIDTALKMVLADPEIENLTVIAPVETALAPENAQISRDRYWLLPIPLPKAGAKLRNMLKRAARDITVAAGSGPDAWSPEHAKLVEDFCKRKASELGDASIYLFRTLDKYLSACNEALLFSARDSKGRLQACAIGDYSSFATAFYMFAFRQPDATPGTADLLLSAICAEAENRGHTSLNLGLGINAGVEFFKKKWQAQPGLPCIETSWQIRRQRKGFFARIFSGRN